MSSLPALTRAFRNCWPSVVGDMTPLVDLTAGEEHGLRLVDAVPADVVADGLDEPCGDGHGPHAGEGLRRAEPAGTGAVRPPADRMPHMQESVVEVDVPDLQGANLPYPQSAYQEPQPDAQPGARGHSPGEPASLFPGDRLLFTSLGWRRLPDRQDERIAVQQGGAVGRVRSLLQDRVQHLARPVERPGALRMVGFIPVAHIAGRDLRNRLAFEVRQEMRNIRFLVPFRGASEIGVPVPLPVLHPFLQVILEQDFFVF